MDLWVLQLVGDGFIRPAHFGKCENITNAVRINAYPTMKIVGYGFMGVALVGDGFIRPARFGKCEKYNQCGTHKCVPYNENCGIWIYVGFATRRGRIHPSRKNGNNGETYAVRINAYPTMKIVGYGFMGVATRRGRIHPSRTFRKM